MDSDEIEKKRVARAQYAREYYGKNRAQILAERLARKKVGSLDAYRIQMLLRATEIAALSSFICDWLERDRNIPLTILNQIIISFDETKLHIDEAIALINKR
jgi:hypothetical protein